MSEPDFQPTLTGPTIIVRPVAPGDWTELYAAGSDPKIWELHPASDRYTEPKFRQFFDDAVLRFAADQNALFFEFSLFVARILTFLHSRAAHQAASPVTNASEALIQSFLLAG